MLNKKESSGGYVDEKLLEIARQMDIEKYGSEEDVKVARASNIDLSGSLHRNDDGTESWVCRKCGYMLVADINGQRARMKVGTNTKVFVKYTEMAARCTHKEPGSKEECGHMNYLTFEGFMDDAWLHDNLLEEVKNDKTYSDEDVQKFKRESFFFEEYERAKLETKQYGQKLKEEVDEYLLGLQ